MEIAGHWCAPPVGWPWAAPISKEQEIAILEEQSKMLESELDSIKKRLEKLRRKEVTRCQTDLVED
jgi:hypothetical protein